MSAGAARVIVREAIPADSAAIAGLHTASWRAHYRGSMSDAFLDGELEPERHRTWSARFAAPQAGQVIVVAEDAGQLVGFACAFAGQDAVWGTLIDNLHVRVDRKRGGLGRTIVAGLGRILTLVAPDRPVHLFVLEANRAAQAFYRKIGGREIDRGRHVLPDGTDNPVIRFAWSSPAALIGATTAA